MEKFYKSVLVSLLFLFLCLASLSALEVGASFQIGNLGFETDREETDDSFSGWNLLWGLSVFGNHRLAENLYLEGGFQKDLILRNISYTLLSYEIDLLSIGVGSFFGVFNSRSMVLKSGISTSLRIDWPGIFFVQFKADNSLGGRLVEDGDYIQERNEASAGFYVHNAICSLNIRSKKFTQKKSEHEIVDLLTDYSFDTNIFQKNLPYRLYFSFSYQSLSKKFIGSTSDPHTLNSIVLGTAVEVNLTDYLTLLFDLESSLFTFGQDYLLGISNPGPGGYLFRLTTGCTINFDRLKERI